ncbi:MAG: hypothetical protein WAV18_26485 [Roseiarcus sp.]
MTRASRQSRATPKLRLFSSRHPALDQRRDARVGEIRDREAGEEVFELRVFRQDSGEVRACVERFSTGSLSVIEETFRTYGFTILTDFFHRQTGRFGTYDEPARVPAPRRSLPPRGTDAQLSGDPKQPSAGLQKG